jgi:tRNA modification GTPase
VVWFAGPRSATGEDVAEFHVHGGTAVVEKLLSELAGLEGCRLAMAGEFSRRAFENGKFDAVELEGLADLLAAESETQRRLAMKQFSGEASSIYEGWRLGLVDILALIEAGIDFAEEEGVAAAAMLQVRPRLRALKSNLEAALAKADAASAVRRGLSVVIAGPPNSGKSTLMNALARRDVAIVSPVAGTTRDVVAEGVMIEGIAVRLADTAGLRAGVEDAIEREGIARSEREIEAADILVWLQAADAAATVEPKRKIDVRVLSKADLLGVHSIHGRNDSLVVSAQTGLGLDDLRARIGQLVRQWSEQSRDGTMVRVRHATAVRAALENLERAMTVDEENLEFMAEDVRKAAHSLAQITGRVDVEDWLGRIYAEFCIGK